MSWKGVITNTGASYLSDWQYSGMRMFITGAKVGSSTRPEANMRAATALVNEEATASIIGYKATSNSVTFMIQVSPGNSTFTMKELGIYGYLGSGGTPKLLALHQNTEGVVIPSASESPEFSFVLLVTHIVDNGTGEATVNIDQGAYVTLQTMEEYATDLALDFGTVTSLPITLSDAAIVEDMVPVAWEIGDDGAFAADPSLTITDGSAVLSGTMATNGSSTVKVYLMHINNTVS